MKYTLKDIEKAYELTATLDSPLYRDFIKNLIKPREFWIAENNHGVRIVYTQYPDNPENAPRLIHVREVTNE